MDKPRPSGSGRLCLPEHPTNRTGPKNTTRTLKVNPPPATKQRSGTKTKQTPISPESQGGYYTPTPPKRKEKQTPLPPRNTHLPEVFLPSRNNRQTTNKQQTRPGEKERDGVKTRHVQSPHDRWHANSWGLQPLEKPKPATTPRQQL